MNRGLFREIAASWYGRLAALTHMATGVIVGAGGAATFGPVSVRGTTDETGRSSLPPGT